MKSSSNPLTDITKEEKMKRASKSKYLQYSIDIDAVLNRLRFPRVLKMARDTCGLVAMSIMEEMIVLGQSSTSTLIVAVCEQIMRQVYRVQRISYA